MVKNKHRLYVAVYPDEDAPDDKERYQTEEKEGFSSSFLFSYISLFSLHKTLVYSKDAIPNR